MCAPARIARRTKLHSSDQPECSIQRISVDPGKSSSDPRSGLDRTFVVFASRAYMSVRAARLFHEMGRADTITSSYSKRRDQGADRAHHSAPIRLCAVRQRYPVKVQRIEEMPTDIEHPTRPAPAYSSLQSGGEDQSDHQDHGHAIRREGSSDLGRAHSSSSSTRPSTMLPNTRPPS